MEFPSWFKENVSILYIYTVKLNYYLNIQSYISLHIYCLQKDIPSDYTDELKALAYGPFLAYSYTVCIVNGVRFVVNSCDLRCTTQNSGVVTFWEYATPFYGQLEEIIELHYLYGKSVVLFRGKWFNASLRNGRIVLIDTSYEWYVGKKTCYDD